MEYRKEIDGLRAIAVLSVMLFHAGFETFGGGFVGVDIFLVISGYLITSLILLEREKGTFSYLNFYERRVRRILPAMLFVVLVTVPFAYLWLLPTAFIDFSRSLVAIPLFLSNLEFGLQSGYFDTRAELKPLLHTWSLAVEEQYYLLFPPFLLAVWKLGKGRLVVALALVCGASLVLAHFGSQYWPRANFFILPTRAWELMIGAIAAVIITYHRNTIDTLRGSTATRLTLEVAGVALIFYSIVIMDGDYPFPSAYTLVPTLGTVLIILFSTETSSVGRVLSNRGLVGIGLISYSAYLWHVPILVFLRHRTLAEAGKPLLLGLLVGVLGLSYLSWKFVEVPARNRALVARSTVFAFALSASIALILTGIAGQATGGFKSRVARNGIALAEIDQRTRVNYGLSAECDALPSVSADCMTDSEPEILVWGDSYAMHLVSGIRASNPEARIAQLTKARCGPVLGLAPVNATYGIGRASSCIDFNERVRDWLKRTPSIKYVVLSSPFLTFFDETSRFYSKERGFSDPTSDALFQELKATLDYFAGIGIRPVVFAPPPTTNARLNPGFCLAKALLLSKRFEACEFSTTELKEKSADVRDVLKKIDGFYPVFWFDPYICEDDICHPSMQQTILYQDHGHLTHEGSAELGRIANFYDFITG